MQPSMEVRWFLHEDLPKATEEWFRSGFVPQKDAPLDDESRDDVYYRLDTQTLSFKLRPVRRTQQSEEIQRFDKVEVKQRHSDAGIQRLGDRVEGHIEQWVKWSFDLLQKNEKGEPARVPDIFTPPGHWIVIKKRRLTRKFAVVASDKVMAVDAQTQRPDKGCNMEIAWLEANGQKWWSVGFEAFSESGQEEHNLQLVIEEVMKDPAFPEMKGEQSYAYPTWLGMLMKNESTAV